MAVAREIIDSVDTRATVQAGCRQTIVDIFRASGSSKTGPAGAYHLVIGLMTDAVVKTRIGFTVWQSDKILTQRTYSPIVNK